MIHNYMEDNNYMTHIVPQPIKSVLWNGQLGAVKGFWLVLFVCLVCCFTSQVNSYGHGGTVSSPNHTFS